jgi:lycopene beta-cyclase
VKKFYDVIFVGAGLANGLAAWRLHQIRPDLEFVILDPSDRFGGNHTWSFHESDISAVDFGWVAPFISASWEGTDVRFPSYRRTVSGRYHSIRSSKFHELLSSAFHYQIGLRHEVKDVFGDLVVLKDGFTIHGGCVVDGRGWQAPGGMSLGYQKFIGLDLTLKAPHGLTRPVIMDATAPQDDGYRFFYVLPWSGNTLMIEDTHYSDGPDIDEDLYRREILAYAAAQGWDVAGVGRAERGSLAIPLNGKAPPAGPGVALSGSRAGLFHATTGYSLPDAVAFAEDFARRPDFHGPVIARWARAQADRHWRRQRFFRLLNRLLFRAAPPAERYKVLESFYRRPDALIARFYAGRLSAMDRVRLLSGVPPVPIHRALRQFIEYGRAA